MNVQGSERSVAAFPLCWPAGWRRSQRRKRAKFSTTYTTAAGLGHFRSLSVSDAIQRLLEEFFRMRVEQRRVVVSTNVKVRLDGLPYSNQAEPTDPGAAVYWEQKGKRMCLAIDQYDRVADNLAAIAATLNCMRGIERHGSAEILERAFMGFKALPAPESWRNVLGVENGSSLAECEAAYRERAKSCHPDLGGNELLFKELVDAIAEARRSLGGSP